MTYRITRGDQTFGPYTAAEVERYLGTGNIVPTDLAQPEDSTQWLPVLELFATPVASRRSLPDPPDLPWWLAMILGLLTGAAFFVAWDIVQTAWFRRVEQRSIAFFLYIAVAVVYVCKLPETWHTVDYNLLGGPLVETHIPGVGVGGILLLVIARLVFRSELRRHFDAIEPLGIRWSALFSLLFGGLYFQYKFNRVNEVKHALRIPRPH